MRAAAAALLLLHTLSASAASLPFDISRHLNTKTPYLFSPKAAETASRTEQGTCSAHHVEYIARHGSRDPTGGDVMKLQTLQALLESEPVRSEIEAYGTSHSKGVLIGWKSPFNESAAGLLTSVGEEEHYNISRRWRFGTNHNETMTEVTGVTETPTGMPDSTVQDLLAQPYFAWRYPIRTTQVSRAARSGNAFGYGLLGQGRGVLGGPEHRFNAFFTYSASANEDRELRFFKVCPRYEKLLVDDKAALAKQQKLFLARRGKEMARSIVTEIFGSDAGNNGTRGAWLDETVASDMWRACAFEASIHGDISRFCSLFTNETALDFEFADDLHTYYTKGWGTKLSYEIACPLLKTIFDGLQNSWTAKGDDLQPAAVMRFAHAETILPFTALLGVYRDATPLLASWTQEQRQSRQWRTSVISPFAGNYAFVLLNCSGRAMVELRHNEVPLEWPTAFGCDGSRCELSVLMDAYATPLTCPFEKYCSNASPPAPAATSSSPARPVAVVSVAMLIVISLVTLVVGLVGGAFAVTMWRRRHEQKGYSKIGEDFTDGSLLSD
jgi:multiple inositol-polyphosphate phosphatase / 2,3-bisphosphoglycerate 3-phosphatase